MSYATPQDAQDIYGAAQIAVCCDRDADGELDLTSFQTHLDMASAQMDAYLLGRYSLPLTFVPAYFKQLCVDIARHNASDSEDVSTLQIKERYKNAITYMELVAQNRVKLEVAVNTTSANISHTPQSIVPSESPCCAPLVSCGTRLFTSANLKNIL